MFQEFLVQEHLKLTQSANPDRPRPVCDIVDGRMQTALADQPPAILDLDIVLQGVREQARQQARAYVKQISITVLAPEAECAPQCIDKLLVRAAAACNLRGH